MLRNTEQMWAEVEPGDYAASLPPEELLDIEIAINARAMLCKRLHNLYRAEPARFTAQHAQWRAEIAALENQIDEVTAELPDKKWLEIYNLQ